MGFPKEKRKTCFPIQDLCFPGTWWCNGHHVFFRVCIWV